MGRLWEAPPGRAQLLPTSTLTPREDPALGVMLWLDMFNTFIFDLVFGK